MKLLRSFVAAALLMVALPFSAQTESVDEIEFEIDSTTSTYRPVSKHFALVKSKKGNSGLNRTSTADSIMNFPVTEIVLVFSETDPGDIAERETANYERWQNLFMTYPQFFQFSTTYKNVCQCNTSGDAENFKKAQGFYIYYTAEEPVAEVKKPAAKPVVKEEEKKPVKEEPVAKKSEEKAKETPAKETPVKENKEKEAVKEPVKTAEAPAPVEEETKTVKPASAKPAKTLAVKKAGAAKARKAKDPKACRPACYENGDDDLNAFFKQNITLSKKQRRHGKNLVSMVRIQLDVDGSIKKVIVTGSDEVLNQQVDAATKMMSSWNATVKNGTTIKSEVRLTLKYDKETKSIKPAEVIVNPRPGPKCQCASDAELFGS